MDTRLDKYLGNPNGRVHDGESVTDSSPIRPRLFLGVGIMVFYVIVCVIQVPRLCVPVRRAAPAADAQRAVVPRCRGAVAMAVRGGARRRVVCGGGGGVVLCCARAAILVPGREHSPVAGSPPAAQHSCACGLGACQGAC